MMTPARYEPPATPTPRVRDSQAIAAPLPLRQGVAQDGPAHQRLAQPNRDQNHLWMLSQDLLCVAALDGTLLNVNPAWSAALGWNQDELLGRTTRWLEHPDDQPISDAIRGGHDKSQQAWNFENRMRHRDGSYRWISWSATLADGRLYGSGRDISERRQMEQRQRENEDALRNAERMETLGQLTGSIAHDFNNLLAGISVSLDLIQRRLPEPTRQGLSRFIDAASASAQRGAALTGSLLAFSLRQSLDLQTLQVNDVIRDMRTTLQERLGSGIALDLQLDPALAATQSDAEQLGKALLHLADNAREAMPDGGRLRVETCNLRLDDDRGGMVPGDYVQLRMHDTGGGMDAHTLRHAFDPFFTTKTENRSSGLGLSVVYGFMKQSGGHIHLDSEPGHGSTVTLYFQRGASMPGHEEPKGLETNGAPQQCILVVEDSDVVRMLTVEVLEELDYAVLEAADAQQALELLGSDRHIDLLMTDIGLPDMNGQELVTKARTLRPELMVLFASGYAESVDLGDSASTAATALIAKPFSLESLRSKVQGMLAH